MIDDDGIMMTLMIIHVDVEDNVDSLEDNDDDYLEDPGDDKHDDRDDDGMGNIDFVQVVLFQGLPISNSPLRAIFSQKI